ncbi:MAG TPA: hypothetical protein VE570_12685 [Thermoleophilaceae bacterium]|nr:hypothetical protein [Thermoleophilaceae bacterium]
MRINLRRASFAATLLAAVAVVTAVVVSRSGAVQPLGPQRTIVTGASVTAPDPIDASSWRLRTIPQATLRCLSAERIGHRQNVGYCARNRNVSWAAARDIERPAPRTVVMGYGARGVRRVTVSGPGGARIFELTKTGRTFLAVFAGRVPLRDLAAVATSANGRHDALDLGGGSLAFASDPHRGPAWFASAQRFTGGPRRGQTCVQVGREQPRFGPAASRDTTHPICSDLTGTDYFFKVIRTQGQIVLTGVAKPSVRSVAARPLTGPVSAGGRSATIARRGGAFLIVFDGARVHADGLTVTIRTRHRTSVFAGQRAMNLGFTQQLPRDLLRDAQSGKGKYLYHGLRISGDAAAQHHLKCSSDLRICDDSMNKVLADALHQGTTGGRYVAPDGDVCPLVPFEPLPPGAEQAAAAEALGEASTLYGGTKVEGATVVRVVPAARDSGRGGYARETCGEAAEAHTLVVYLRFPAMEPSASMSQGVVLVGRFWGQMRVWAQLH